MRTIQTMGPRRINAVLQIPPEFARRPPPRYAILGGRRYSLVSTRANGARRCEDAALPRPRRANRLPSANLLGGAHFLRPSCCGATQTDTRPPDWRREPVRYSKWTAFHRPRRRSLSATHFAGAPFYGVLASPDVAIRRKSLIPALQGRAEPPRYQIHGPPGPPPIITPDLRRVAVLNGVYLSIIRPTG